ncbi:hypothetical protein AALB16_13195 [Lachnospiraceae bacterium 62-35]
MELMIEKLKSEEELIDLVQNYPEIVIYGAGRAGKTLVHFFNVHGWRGSICCCAVRDRASNLRDILTVPVLQYKELPHLRESALFLIGAAEQYQEEIYQDLVRFGCKKIKVIDHVYLLEMERWKENEEKKKSMEILMEEKFAKLERQLKFLQYRVEEQNEVCITNTEAFKEFENCNYGKDVIVAATGPTAKYYKPMENAVHIGVNYAWRMQDIPIDYLFIQDGNREIKDYQEMLSGALEKVEGTIFLARYLKRELMNEVEYPVQADSKGRDLRRYWIEGAGYGGLEFPSEIYQNICCHPLMDFTSVIFSALHFALWTYPKRIYLVGCDTNGFTGHFYEDGKNCNSRFYADLNRWKYGYACVKKFADFYYPNTEIISINPVGLKGLFRDEYTENFLKDRKRENEL